MKATTTNSALRTQVGGGHYKTLKIQPVEYIHANRMGYIEGAVVKYITRFRDKGGVEDLLKIKHFVDLLIELEYPEWEPGKKVRRTTKSTTRQRKRKKIARRATEHVVRLKPKVASTRVMVKNLTTSGR